jgi:hypothetical protein
MAFQMGGPKWRFIWRLNMAFQLGGPKWRFLSSKQSWPILSVVFDKKISRIAKQRKEK